MKDAQETTISLRIPVELKDEIDRIAKVEDRTASQIIRALIRDWVKGRKRKAA